MTAPVPMFKPGDEVRRVSHPEQAGVVVSDGERFQGRYWYRVHFGPGRVKKHPQDDLEAAASLADDIEGMLLDGRFGSRDAFAKLVTHLKLTHSLRSEIYSLHASRTTFYPHQFMPLLKLLDSEKHRILIGDEVGLGKTIEAGLILTELRQRQDMRRVLVIPPSHLVPKWREEMRRRFGLDFEVLNTSGLLQFLDRFAEEQEEASLLGIVSLQAFRGRRLQDRWEEVGPSFDVVIFDEAGRLRNVGSQSHHAAACACENTEAALLLTATPVQTGKQDLFYLLQLLDPVEFDSFEIFRQRLDANGPVLQAQSLLSQGRLTEAAAALRLVESTALSTRFTSNPIYLDLVDRLIKAEPQDRRALVELQRDLVGLNVLAHVFSRTKKREVEENRILRVARTYRRKPTAEEEEFYAQVTRRCRQRYAAGNAGAAFFAVTAQRQTASCMVAVVDHWMEQQDQALGGDYSEATDIPPEELNLEAGDEDQPGAVSGELGDLRTWRDRLARSDTKFDALKRALEELQAEEPGRKVVVFAFFKRTLSYLENRLNALGIGCVRVDGDVPSAPDDPQRDERGKRIERFRTDPKIRVLLSSEVGDEGIDLQFASVLVNYDLPWNPMRVEQRIGRLDRLGQTAPRVVIINLSLEGTIEDRILDRLYMRIGIFEQSIGDLEDILGEEVGELQRALFSPQLTEEEQQRRIEQTALAIERRRQDTARFARESERLLGNEQFFRDEIDAAWRQKRYVGGEELLIYVRDFLRDHYRGCTIDEDTQPGLYRLKVSEDLRQLIIRSVPAEDLGRRQFLARSASGEVLITTDQNYAERNGSVDFLTFHHPLVRSVKGYYEEHGGELHPVAFVGLRSDRVPPGKYAWFLFETTIAGARLERELDLIVFPEGAQSPLSEEEARDVLSELSASAEAIPSGRRELQTDPGLGSFAQERAAELLAERKTRRARVNEALVENRLASLRESYERNRKIQEKRLATARQRGREASYLRGIESRIRNLEAAYEQRRQQIEIGKTLGEELLLCGAGGLEVRKAS